MASYESLLSEIIPVVPGCTDTLIEQNIRAAVIELCEKTEVYQKELDPVSTVENIFEYDLEPPSSTTVHRIIWMTYDGEDLEAITNALLEQRKPKWRQSGYEGRPEYFVKQSPSLFYVAPVPNETKVNGLLLRVALKPTHTSSSCDTDIMNDYRDTIINGTIYRLLRLPGREWTDYTGAQIYGSLFLEGVASASEIGKQSASRVARKVRYSGTGPSYRLTRTKYSKR
tara:strand:- start:462 stop:1142 length:681 start_codon:yes stop_codon:yes gene_type:complete